MVFQYKFPGLYPVDAQTAGEELERIFNTPGKLDPANIVNESRDESAPLHPIFEWDDTKAAEKYRETQAETLMRSVVTIVDTPHGPQEVRAVVNVQQTYTPIHVVLESREQTDILLETALKELKAFQKKYAYRTRRRTSQSSRSASRPRRASNFPGLSSRYGTSLYNHNYVIPSEASVLYFNLIISSVFALQGMGWVV